jgi:hypothetical protein
VTDIRDHRGNRILERGPWHTKQESAEFWADTLRGLGYKVTIERMDGGALAGVADTSLADALASMA